jgi:diamine N-acetyltransferase
MVMIKEAITIHKATAADATVLAKLGACTIRQTYGATFSSEDIDRHIEENFSVTHLNAELANPEVLYLLATVNQQPCGYAKLRPTSTPSTITGPQPIELVRLYLDSEWIGQGIGAKLMQTALEFAVNNGSETCWLRVLQGNTRAIAFYRRWGFVEVGSELYPAGEIFIPVLVMTIHLSQFLSNR